MATRSVENGALVRLGEATRLTGLTRYTLLGLARRRVLTLKALPTVSGSDPNRKTYYLYRDEVTKLVTTPEYASARSASPVCCGSVERESKEFSKRLRARLQAPLGGAVRQGRDGGKAQADSAVAALDPKRRD